MKHSYAVAAGGLVLLASCMAPPPAAGPSVDAPTSLPLSAAGRTAPALVALAEIPVRGRAPKTGYTRDQFGDRWTDDNGDLWGHNGCDTRDDVLRRDLTAVVLRSGDCTVSTGLLHDPYTGVEVAFVRGPGTSSAVQIDHMKSVSVKP